MRWLQTVQTKTDGGMKKIMFNERYGLTAAVLEGRKTQTRRIVMPQPDFLSENFRWAKKNDGEVILPYYGVGDIVAVAQDYSHCGGIMSNGVPRWKYISKVVGPSSAGWRNKMFVRPELMPHQIRITDIRVERLQNISDDDCMKEGIIYEKELATSRPYGCLNEYGAFIELGSTLREAFAALIDKVSGKGTWDKNPYVFVYEFELVE